MELNEFKHLTQLYRKFRFLCCFISEFTLNLFYRIFPLIAFMFVFSKIVAWFTQPLTWLLMALVTGWLASVKRPRLARHFLAGGALLLALIGWQALPKLLIQQLESRYPEVALSGDVSAYAGVVVLGGGTAAGRLQQSHAQALSNEAGERLSVSAALALRHPDLPLLYTGGEGDPAGSGPSEAARARVFYESFRIPPGQVRYESESRNTYENAVFSAKLPGVNPQSHWLLLTSAWHMPRSMATFQKAGWNVTAYPVDFRAEDRITWTDYSLQSGVSDWQLVLNELVGLVAYRLTGRL
jgi:uncharacterized SAM-binding protein YcdF (DUF218 family)